MATLNVSGLEQLLENLLLSTPVPQFDLSDVPHKPLDICRSYLADILSSLVNCEPTAAYSSVQLSNDPLHGDFTIVLPRLCPGAKAGELAHDIIKKVTELHHPHCSLLLIA
jgi:arginyl-tRNA synthetase